jgi:ADP-heptose:LPS heptosyltransferase
LPNLLIATIPCVNRITPRKKGLRGFLSSNGRAFTTAKNAYTQIYPAIAREAIKAVGGLPSPVVPRAVLSPSKQGRDNARRILKECNITEGKFVAVLPGGGTNPGQNTNVKQYPRMDEAVALFQQKHPEIPVCLLGDKNDREACQKVKAGVAKGNLCIDLHGKTDLETLVALIQSAQAVLCNDSGPLHIAMALNIPTVAVFGPTVPQFVLDPRAPVWGVRQITKSGYSGKFRGNEKEAVDTFAKLRPEMVAVKLQRALDVYSIGHKN